jgi:DNA-binding HxlR family transcriptional regulator
VEASQCEDDAVDRDAWDLAPDSVQRALDALAPRSAGRIVREAFYGTRRFDDFSRRTGLTPAVLAARLRDLVEHGLLERSEYRDPGRRTRHEYRLTAKGRDLGVALVALLDWADRWLPGPDGPTVALTHAGCGSPVHAVLSCEAGHALHRLGEAVAGPGPGATPAAPATPAARPAGG